MAQIRFTGTVGTIGKIKKNDKQYILHITVLERHTKYKNHELEKTGTTWFHCVLINKDAIANARILKPNAIITISGTLETHTFWREGKKQSSQKVLISSLGIVPQAIDSLEYNYDANTLSVEEAITEEPKIK